MTRREAAESDLERYEAIKPWIDAYLPNDPFRTLVVLVVVVLVGTIVKDSFLTVGSFLVDRVSQLAVFDLRKQFYRRTLRLDLASFTEAARATCYRRFTHDVENVGRGHPNAVRPRRPRAAEDVGLPDRRRLDLLATAARLADRGAAGRLS